MIRTFTTQQVADAVGVHKMTLLHWLWAGKIREPRRIGSGRIYLRAWTDRDVARVKRFKAENYRKGRGRKPKVKR